RDYKVTGVQTCALPISMTECNCQRGIYRLCSKEQPLDRYGTFNYDQLIAAVICTYEENLSLSPSRARDRRQIRSTKKGSVSSLIRLSHKLSLTVTRSRAIGKATPLPREAVRWARYRSRLKNKKEWFLSIPKCFLPQW